MSDQDGGLLSGLEGGSTVRAPHPKRDWDEGDSDANENVGRSFSTPAGAVYNHTCEKKAHKPLAHLAHLVVEMLEEEGSSPRTSRSSVESGRSNRGSFSSDAELSTPGAQPPKSKPRRRLRMQSLRRVRQRELEDESPFIQTDQHTQSMEVLGKLSRLSTLVRHEDAGKEDAHGLPTGSRFSTPSFPFEGSRFSIPNTSGGRNSMPTNTHQRLMQVNTDEREEALRDLLGIHVPAYQGKPIPRSRLKGLIAKHASRLQGLTSAIPPWEIVIKSDSDAVWDPDCERRAWELEHSNFNLVDAWNRLSQLNHPEPDSNPEDGAREKEKVVEFIGRCLKAQFHMFASLPEAVLRELLNKLVYRHFKEPTAIVSQGCEGHCCCVVLEGEVEVRVRPDQPQQSARAAPGARPGSKTLEAEASSPGVVDATLGPVEERLSYPQVLGEECLLALTTVPGTWFTRNAKVLTLYKVDFAAACKGKGNVVVLSNRTRALLVKPPEEREVQDIELLCSAVKYHRHFAHLQQPIAARHLISGLTLVVPSEHEVLALYRVGSTSHMHYIPVSDGLFLVHVDTGSLFSTELSQDEMRTLLNSEPSLVLPVPRGELVGQRAMHGRVASEQMDVVLVARSGTQLIEVPNASFSDLYRMMFLGDTLLERRQRKPRQSVNRRLSLRVNSLAKVMESNERQAGWGAAKVRLGVRRPSTKFADLGLGAGASGVGHLKANEKQTLVRVGQLLCIQPELRTEAELQAVVDLLLQLLPVRGSFLGTLDAEARLLVARHATFQSFAAREVVAAADEAARGVYLVLAGKAGVFLQETVASSPGKADAPEEEEDELLPLISQFGSLIDVRKVGEEFGHAAVAAKRPRTTTVVALERIALLVFPAHDYAKKIHKLYKPQLDLQMSLLAHIAPLKGHHRKMMDIVECMHEVTFHRGHTVVAEEALVSDMFVVKQGKLKEVKRVPPEQRKALQTKVCATSTSHLLRPNKGVRGYKPMVGVQSLMSGDTVSSTSNLYNPQTVEIACISTGQWCGEDLLFGHTARHVYSVVVETEEVVLYSIPNRAAFAVFPAAAVEYFKELFQAKKEKASARLLAVQSVLTDSYTSPRTGGDHTPRPEPPTASPSSTHTPRARHHHLHREPLSPAPDHHQAVARSASLALSHSSQPQSQAGLESSPCPRAKVPRLKLPQPLASSPTSASYRAPSFATPSDPFTPAPPSVDRSLRPASTRRAFVTLGSSSHASERVRAEAASLDAPLAHCRLEPGKRLASIPATTTPSKFVGLVGTARRTLSVPDASSDVPLRMLTQQRHKTIANSLQPLSNALLSPRVTLNAGTSRMSTDATHAENSPMARFDSSPRVERSLGSESSGFFTADVLGAEGHQGLELGFVPRRTMLAQGVQNGEGMRTPMTKEKYNHGASASECTSLPRRAEQSISESKGLCSPHGGCKYSLGAMTGSSLQAVAHPRLKPFTTNSAIIDTSPISLMQLNNSNTAAAQRTSEIFATGRLQQSQSLLELPRPTGMSLGELTHSVAAQADQLYAPHTQLTARLQPVKGVQPPMRVHGGVWVSKEERKTKTNLAIEKHWDTKFRPTSGRAATGGPNIVYEVKSPLTNDNAETHLCTLTGQNMFVHHKASTLRT